MFAPFSYLSYSLQPLTVLHKLLFSSILIRQYLIAVIDDNRAFQLISRLYVFPINGIDGIVRFVDCWSVEFAWFGTGPDLFRLPEGFDFLQAFADCFSYRETFCWLPAVAAPVLAFVRYLLKSIPVKSDDIRGWFTGEYRLCEFLNCVVLVRR